MHVGAHFAKNRVGWCGHRPLAPCMSSTAASHAEPCGCATRATQARRRRSLCARATKSSANTVYRAKALLAEAPAPIKAALRAGTTTINRDRATLRDMTSNDDDDHQAVARALAWAVATIELLPDNLRRVGEAEELIAILKKRIGVEEAERLLIKMRLTLRSAQGTTG